MTKIGLRVGHRALKRLEITKTQIGEVSKKKVSLLFNFFRYSAQHVI